MPIRLAETDRDIRSAYPVVVQLRPHLGEAELVDQVRRQEAEGYRLAILEEDGKVRAAAGFRILLCLAWGKHLYVDDLVTDEAARSRGHGQALFDWLIARAREHGCAELHLDSGVQRFAAHRFYLRNRMSISSHHFSLRLP